jgi:hypothetical protein
VVVAITSQIPAALGEDELRLPDADLAACDLPKPSVVKLGKIFTIHQGLVRKSWATCRRRHSREFGGESWNHSVERPMKEPRYELMIFWDEADEICPGVARLHGSWRDETRGDGNAEAAIELWIETAKEDGIAIPEPRDRLMFA